VGVPLVGVQVQPACIWQMISEEFARKLKVGMYQLTTRSVMDTFDVDICNVTGELIDWRVRSS
tara:strand:- start:110 stop:298 length:189 start_codon:yes stop_codon:yes gene_type:complete